MSAFLSWLDGAVAALEAQARELRASGCKDESDLVRIRINIHQIARTLYLVCRRSGYGSDFRAAYLAKLDALIPPWTAARSLAVEHDDPCRVIIEDIKLDTLRMLRIRYLETE
ncbi:MAG: hypothetical protein J6K32_05965 [Clostridia bacterium]|nr:hypothetical protein [Clostridia bacterium]